MDSDEASLISQLFPPNTSHSWLSICSLRAHRIVVPFTGTGAKRRMLLLHGTASSAALVASSCARWVGGEVELHVVDLPGYGRTPEEEDRGEYDAAKTLDLMCAFIESYTHSYLSDCPFYVAGWSVGGLYALEWASRHNNTQAVNLILISSVGFGRPDWLSVRFGTYILPAACHAFGFIAPALPLRYRYWLRVNAAASNVAARFAGMWTTRLVGTLHAVLSKRTRVAFVWGDCDGVLPYGDASIAASESGVPFITMPGAGHVCFHHDGGRTVAKALAAAVRSLDDDGRWNEVAFKAAIRTM